MKKVVHRLLKIFWGIEEYKGKDNNELRKQKGEGAKGERREGN